MVKHYLITVDLFEPARLHAYLMTAHKADTERAASKMLDYAEKQKLHPLGIVLVTGMAIGTIFTLFFVPSVYMLLAARHRRVEHIDPVGQPAIAKAIPHPAGPTCRYHFH